LAAGWGCPFEVAVIIDGLHMPAVAVGDGMVVVAEECEVVEVCFAAVAVMNDVVCFAVLVCCGTAGEYAASVADNQRASLRLCCESC